MLDPFCGCGTTVHAAQSLGRPWIGVDVSVHAIHVIEQRLKASFREPTVPKPEGRIMNPPMPPIMLMQSIG